MLRRKLWYFFGAATVCLTAALFAGVFGDVYAKMTAAYAHPSAQAKSSGGQTQSLLWSSFDVSPDGKTIAFSGNGSGGKDLYLLNLATNKVTQLTNTPDYENYPAFSPDGKTLVYQAVKDLSQPRHLFLRSLDGKHVRQLTNTPATNDENPSFSPNGERIVFARAQTFHAGARGENPWGGIDTFVVGRGGGPVFQVTHLNSGGMMQPRFYPDSRHVIFEETRVPNSLVAIMVSSTTMTLAKADADGKEPVQKMRRFSESDGGAFFFPGGKQIVFSGNFGGIVDLYQMSLPNGKPSKVLPWRFNTGFCDPIITANGKSIYCVGRYNPNIYRMDTDGKNLHRVADSSLFSDPLHWKPDQTQKE